MTYEYYEEERTGHLCIQAWNFSAFAGLDRSLSVACDNGSTMRGFNTISVAAEGQCKWS